MPPKAGSKRSRGRGNPQPALDDLPLPAVTTICRLLQLRDRFNFLFSSPALWRQLGASSELWGDLDVDVLSAACIDFLASKRHTLRRLKLRCSGGEDTIALLLGSLAGSSTLQELEWKVHLRSPSWAYTTISTAVFGLPGLRSLALEVWGQQHIRLEAALRGATSLSSLHIQGPSAIVAATGALPPSLQQLSVPSMRDRVLARLLACTPHVRDLNAELIPSEDGQADIEAIAALPALTSLTLRVYGGQALDLRPLAAHSCQAALGLRWYGALELLRQVSGMAGLTSLELCLVGADGPVPPELSAMTALQQLNLSASLVSNPASAGSLSTLTALAPSLTCLNLSWNRGLLLPPQLSALSALKRLELKYALDAGSEQSLGSCLLGMRGLTHMDLSGSTMGGLPSGLSQLSELAVLLLRDSSALNGAGSLGLIAQLQGLTELDISGCTALGMPPELLTLPRLQDLTIDVEAAIEFAPELEGLACFTALALRTVSNVSGGLKQAFSTRSVRRLLRAVANMQALRRLSIDSLPMFYERCAEAGSAQGVFEEAMRRKGWVKLVAVRGSSAIFSAGGNHLAI